MEKYDNTNKKTNFAIVGAGHIGKRHGSMILNNEDTNLIAFCDILPKNKVSSTLFNKIPFYLTIDEMLNNHPEIDIVCVCTPNGLHSQQAIQLLHHKKHVVIEKPLGLKKYDCENVLFHALKNNCYVFGVMQNRYSPPSTWLKKIVSEKIIGDVFMVQVNCYWNRDERYYKEGGWKGTQDLDGGTLFTQFSHFIDIMYWLFGDIKNIQGKFQDFTHNHSTDFEDSGFVSFDFLEGGMGSLNYSTAVWDENLESVWEGDVNNIPILPLFITYREDLFFEILLAPSVCNPNKGVGCRYLGLIFCCDLIHPSIFFTGHGLFNFFI